MDQKNNLDTNDNDIKILNLNSDQVGNEIFEELKDIKYIYLKELHLSNCGISNLKGLELRNLKN